MLDARVRKTKNGVDLLESKRFGTIAERTLLPIVSPELCFELFLLDNRSNNRMKANVMHSMSQFPASVAVKHDKSHKLQSQAPRNTELDNGNQLCFVLNTVE
jgi:hypothetical protein